MISIDNGDENPKASVETEAEDGWSLGEHLPLIITAFSALIVGIRVFTVAGDNYENVYAILQANGTTTVIAGTLIPAIGYFAFPLAGIILGMLMRNRVRQPSKPFVFAAVAFLLVTGIVTAPIILYVGIVLSLVAGWGVVKLFRIFAKPRSESVSKGMGWLQEKIHSSDVVISFIAVTSALTFFVFVSNSIPWVPAEDIVVTNLHPFTGYVFGETDTDVLILTGDTHQIIHIAPSQVISRTVCQPNGIIYGGVIIDSLAQLIGRPNYSNYPPCPR
jgi:hypothetical protein